MLSAGVQDVAAVLVLGRGQRSGALMVAKAAGAKAVAVADRELLRRLVWCDWGRLQGTPGGLGRGDA